MVGNAWKRGSWEEKEEKR
ncbi:Protein CBG27520 [Caenorhabditis briggsae]|uniref:Protein CBG27520 n=1 Tax=Caenorhabditis briggsae TaxID=6238 RepID=B6IKI1_CAEBR|nr:Protein CBG27520 [Caenorhabditis briggsae]CAS00411.1 Protein CBG27520 [Caenorhabditis briggsae]